MTHKIEVIGLGAGDINQIPLGVYRQLTKISQPIYVRTAEHPVIEELRNEGVTFQSFDEIYEQYDTFEEVYQQIVTVLLKEAQNKEIIYAVPGHPMLAEYTVKLLLEQAGKDQVKVSIMGGQSYLDAMFNLLKVDPIEGFQFLDATAFTRQAIQYNQHLIFCQVYDQYIASQVKLALMEDLPYDYPVKIVCAAGSKEEWVKDVPLYELDREVELNNLISLYIPPVPLSNLNHKFERLREVIAELRGPDGCPWDKEQTHESLRPYLIEEAYEVLEAIEDKDDEGLVEELGDVLLQVMLHSQIGEDEGYFTVDDVIRSITDKMIRRHPHVFGDVQVENSEQVVGNWEEIKKQEKNHKQESILDGISKSVPGLLYGYELQKKAAKVGFDWDNPKPIWEKVHEEIEEFNQALQDGDKDNAELELGDVLFAIINLARYYKINPELAVQRTNNKFERRFKYMEQAIQKKGLQMKELELEALDLYWEEAKRYFHRN